MPPSLTYTVKYKDKSITFLHSRKHYNFGDAMFKITLNIKDIIMNHEARFLRLFDKLVIINDVKPNISEEEQKAYDYVSSLGLTDYMYMMAYEYDLMTIMRGGYAFTFNECGYGDVHIEVDFNRREIRELVDWLLVARKIYSFDEINEAIADGAEVY